MVNLPPNLRLLVLCIPFKSSPELVNQVNAAASQITAWETLPTLAEQHGMAPLLYFHLKKLPDSIPVPILRSLRAQALRDRLFNQVRSRQVAAIAASFEQAGVTLVFVKGAALAHNLYPEPGLRPMSDLDVLVRRADINAAREIFQSLGFQSGGWPHNPEKSRHLPAFHRVIDGLPIGIELHYALLQDSNGRPWFEMQDITTPPVSFAVNPQTSALTLPNEEMLFHLCQHTFFNNNGFDPLRLMWVADIVNFANRFTHEIDWSKIRRLYPSVLHALAILHTLSPLSPLVISQAGLQPADTIGGTGIDFQGWPVLPVPGWKSRGYLRIFWDTFFPSPWWLRLHYGMPGSAGDHSFLWYYWARHCVNLAVETRRRKIPHD